MDRSLQIEIPIGDLIPHTGPSILLERVIDIWDDGILCATRVSAGQRFVQENGVGASICIEWMAQAIAAFSGYQRLQRAEDIVPGFLISCRRLELQMPWLEIDTEVEVTATTVRDGGTSLASFECTVATQGLRVATAVLNVYQGKLKGVGE